MAKCVSPSASVMPAYNNAEPAGGQMSNFALSIHSETLRGQEGGGELVQIAAETEKQSP